MTPKAQVTKDTIDKSDYTEVKNFCTSEDITDKMKR